MKKDASVKKQINDLINVGVRSHKKVMNLIEKQQDVIQTQEREMAEFSVRLEKLENAVSFYLKKAS